MIRTDAELSTGLVDSLANAVQLNDTVYLPSFFISSGCKGFWSSCYEIADVADTGQICPVLSLPATASRDILP